MSIGGHNLTDHYPFLSDIDITVITDGQDSKLRAEKHLQRLQKYLPMLETQSPVLTIKEFESWSDPELSGPPQFSLSIGGGSKHLDSAL